MQPTIGRIEKLTTRPCPPTGGSGVPSPTDKIIAPILIDTTELNEAIRRAEILLRQSERIKANLSEVKEILGKARIDFELYVGDRDSDPLDKIKQKIFDAHKSGDLRVKLEF